MTWTRTRIRGLQPATDAPRRALLAAAGVGVVCDAMLHPGMRGFGLALVVVTLAAGLLAAGGARGLEARLWLTASFVLGAACTLRASGWVEAPLATTAVLTLLLAARPEGGGSAFDVAWTDIAIGWLDTVLSALLSPPWIARGARRQVPGARRVVPGMALALTLIAVLGALLASADPVFASLVQLDANDIALHIALIFGGALVAGWTARRALSEAQATAVTVRGPLSPMDVTIALGAVTALFATFVAIQLAVATGMAAATLRAQGITLSDYARSGYFQLLCVAGVVVLILPWARAAAAQGTRGQRRIVAGLSLAVVALTAVILCVAVRRLGLYDSAYGLTMPRLFSLTGAVFMACLLVLLAASSIHRTSRWFPAGAVCSLVLVVTAFAIMNPEATVASYNLHRSGPVEVDRDYLLSLSSDATTLLVPAFGKTACKKGSSFDWRLWTLSDLRANAVCR